MPNTPSKTPFNRERKKAFAKSVYSSLLLGMVRGIGMAIGFSGFAVILVFVIEIIPLDKLPIIGEFVREFLANR